MNASFYNVGVKTETLQTKVPPSSLETNMSSGQLPEIISFEQLKDETIVMLSKEKILEAALQLEGDEIIVTDFWGPNTVVFRDSEASVKDKHRCYDSGYYRARRKAAELTGQNEEFCIYISGIDPESPNEHVGAVRIGVRDKKPEPAKNIISKTD
ncbi:hypothetical protein HJFPF1_07660 [Paramyrothecium foliicola]|nr:hypothetical protein HJFPF1_07660 [Paramyrothecium foliicola]